MRQDATKNKYYVMLCADGEASGEIELSEEEYKIVKYATNPENWKNLKEGKDCGCFIISSKPIIAC